MRRVTRDRFTSRSREVKRFLNELPGKMADKFQEVTPIRSGNARSKTSLQNQKNITADYPYAGRLEKDAWSRQAPDGMSQPTIDFARDLFRRLR
jgi:hypothetical protein